MLPSRHGGHLLNGKDPRCRQPVIAPRRFTRPARGWIRLLASRSAHQWHPAPRQPRPPDRPVWDIRHPSARLSANLAVRGASSPPIGFRSDPSSWLFLSGNGSAPRGYTPIHVNRGATGLGTNRRLPVPKLGPRSCAYHSTDQCADPDHDHVTAGLSHLKTPSGDHALSPSRQRRGRDRPPRRTAGAPSAQRGRVALPPRSAAPPSSPSGCVGRASPCSFVAVPKR